MHCPILSFLANIGTNIYLPPFPPSNLPSLHSLRNLSDGILCPDSFPDWFPLGKGAALPTWAVSGPHRISHFQMLSTTWRFNLLPSLGEENKEKQGSALPGPATFGTWKLQDMKVHLCKDVCSKANLTFRKIRFSNFYYFSRFNEFNALSIRTLFFSQIISGISGLCR